MATPQSVTNNYTLGRGEVYFARFLDEVTKAPAGERYIGNTPEFSVTIGQDVLDHFSSDHGVREKDESIALQVNRSGTVTCDNIDMENLALFFFGEKSIVADAGGAVDEVLLSVQQGYHYQLGISESRPAGAKSLVGDTDDSNSAGAFAVTLNDSNSGTALVNGTDYEIDYELGRLYIVPDGGIADGSELVVSYIVEARSMDRVISGSQPVAGAVRFIAFNPVGTDFDYYFPYVKISPNGDYSLKSDEWATIPFSLEILKRSDREAIYVDNRPYTP